MDEEATDELGRGQPHHLLAVARFDAVILPAEGDGLGIGADQTGVRDRHAVSISAQVGQHGLRPPKWRLGIDVPSRMITFPLGDQRFSWQDRF
jgi:hypothetical protein